MGTDSQVAICNCRNAPNCRHYITRVTSDHHTNPVIPPPHAPSVIRHHHHQAAPGAGGAAAAASSSQVHHHHHQSHHQGQQAQHAHSDVAGIEEMEDYHSQYHEASLSPRINGHRDTLQSVAVSHSSYSTNSISPSPSAVAAAGAVHTTINKRGHTIRDPVTNNDIKYPKSEYCSPSSCICLLIALILISIGATSGIFFGLRSYDGRHLKERVFKVQFIVTRGEPYDPRFENANSDLFKETSVKYEEKLNKLLNTSRLAKSFKKSEIIALEKAKDASDDVVVHANLHFNPRLRNSPDTAFSSADVYILLSTEFLKTRNGLFSSVTIDQASLDVTERKREGLASRYNIPFYPKSDSLSSNGDINDQLARLTGNDVSFYRGSNVYNRNPWEARPRFPGVLQGLTTEATPPVRRCQKIDIPFCSSILPYNSTSYPNIVGHWNVTSLEESFIAFRQIVDAECYPLAREFICRILQPECEHDELVYPCRDFCNDFKRSCGTWIEKDDKKKSLFDKMIKCTDFPRYDGDDGSDEVNLSKTKSHDDTDRLNKNRQHYIGTSVVYYDEEFTGRYSTRNEKRKCRSKPGCSNELKVRGRPHHLCDGVIDCPDSSDETSCDYCSSGINSHQITSNRFSNVNSNRNDEKSDLTKNAFYCGNKQCIESRRVCDSVIDCNNGADEENCLRLEPTVLLDPEFVYQRSGVLVSKIRGKNAKVCAEKIENTTIPLLRNSYTLERSASNLCLALGYKQLIKVEPKVDNDRRSLFTQVEEMNVESTSYLRQSETACNSRQVILVTCDGLICGKNPLFAPPDKRADEVLPSTLKRIYEQYDKTIDTLPGSIYNANDGDWPWTAALFKDGQFLCDATLISDQWVLTSASCLEENTVNNPSDSSSSYTSYSSASRTSSRLKVSLGSVRLTAKSPLFAQEKEVTAQVHSPADRTSFSTNSGSNNSDKVSSSLSLLKLDTPVNSSNYVRPVCVHSNSISSTEFRKLSSSDCFTTNWDVKKDRLEFIRSSIVDIKDCDSSVDTDSGDTRWRDLNICVRVPHAKDGQIVVPGRALYCVTSTDTFSIIGLEAPVNSAIAKRNRITDQITSSSSSTLLFTRVSHHAGWIYQILDSFKRSASSIDEIRVTAPTSYQSGPVYALETNHLRGDDALEADKLSPHSKHNAPFTGLSMQSDSTEKGDMNWPPEISSLT